MQKLNEVPDVGHDCPSRFGIFDARLWSGQAFKGQALHHCLSGPQIQEGAARLAVT